MIPRQVVDTEGATERRVATEGWSATVTILAEEVWQCGVALGVDVDTQETAMRAARGTAMARTATQSMKGAAVDGGMTIGA